MSTSIYLRQQTELLTNILIEEDYPELKLVNGDLLPIKSIGSYLETIAYRIYSKQGETVILANGGTDIPSVSNFVEKRYAEIYTLANKFEYTTIDINRAMMLGVDLDGRLATDAREIMERDIDLTGYDGRTGTNLIGLLNQPNVVTFVIPNDGNSNGGVNSTRFRHKTAEQIYRDLVNYVSSIRIDTNGVETADTLLIPREEFEIINSLPYPSNSAAAKTIMTFFLETQGASGGISRIVPVDYLNTKGSSGFGQMVAYRNDSRKIEFHLPLLMTMQPMEYANMTYSFPLLSQVAGVILYKPASMRYAFF